MYSHLPFILGAPILAFEDVVDYIPFPTPKNGSELFALRVKNTKRQAEKSRSLKGEFHSPDQDGRR